MFSINPVWWKRMWRGCRSVCNQKKTNPCDNSSLHCHPLTLVWICPSHTQLSLCVQQRSSLSQLIRHKKDKEWKIPARDSHAWCLSAFLPDASSQSTEDRMSVRCSRHTQGVITAGHWGQPDCLLTGFTITLSLYCFCKLLSCHKSKVPSFKPVPD